jgi:hypothetical protein
LAGFRGDYTLSPLKYQRRNGEAILFRRISFGKEALERRATLCKPFLPLTPWTARRKRGQLGQVFMIVSPSRSAQGASEREVATDRAMEAWYHPSIA